jgi:hypothetical protein
MLLYGDACKGVAHIRASSSHWSIRQTEPGRGRYDVFAIPTKDNKQLAIWRDRVLAVRDIQKLQ